MLPRAVTEPAGASLASRLARDRTGGRRGRARAPDLRAGHDGHKLAQNLAGAEVVGPVLTGLAKPAIVLTLPKSAAR